MCVGEKEEKCGVMARQTYQSMREQLIALSVEIDDRAKVCSALEEKVDEERAKLSRLEDDLKKDYEHRIEEEVHSHKENMEKIMKVAADGMQAKKDLLEKCKKLVSEVKDNEQNSSREMRKISKEFAAKIESERKNYRSGQESRQRKFLLDKLKEFEESTLNALEPEFSRLRINLQHELAEVTSKLEEDTRRMKSDMKASFDRKLANAEKQFRDDQKMMARVRLDEAVVESEALEREHKRKISQLSEELTAALDIFRNNLNQKVKRERELNAAALRESEKNYLDKMSSLRSRHEEDISSLQKEHQKKIQALRSNLEKRKEDFLDNEAHEVPEGASLTESEQDALEALRKELDKKRDAKLKAEIRRLQTDTALVEQEANSYVEDEKKRITESHTAEETQLKKKQRAHNDQMAELTAQKNKLAGETKAVLDEMTSLQEELSSVRLKCREAEGIQHKVKQKRKEIEDTHSLQMERMESAQKAKLQNLWNCINDLNTEMSKSTKKHDAELQELEEKHEASLNELNAEVKQDVMRKDDELDCLRDAVQSEKVKMERLKKLLAKYV